jgi:hypothetical protein
MRIKTNSYMSRFLVIDKVYQGINKAKLRIGIFAFGSDPRAAN